MKILFFGDIFGQPGRSAIAKVTPLWAKKYKPDFIIGNVENLAHGSGITAKTLDDLNKLELFNCYTSGDHIFDKPDAEEIIKNSATPVAVPANAGIPKNSAGYKVVQTGIKKLLVINLVGTVFMRFGEKYSNPLLVADDILKKFTLDHEEDGKEYVNGIFVDFHAEATAEKRVLAAYLEGRVSAIVGTHTHVPTRDEKILPGGTAFITDVGMVGPYESSLGLELKPLIDEYITGKKNREVAGGKEVEVGAALIDIDKNGKGEKIEHLREIIDI